MRVILAIVTLLTGVLFWGLFRSGHHLGALRTSEPSSDPVHEQMTDEGEAGARLYRLYCAGCHGDGGAGDGPAAAFLDPKPRDFTTGVYKFVSSPGGTLPSDEDLHRTITYGLYGTSMPGWKFLSLVEREQLIEHLKTFYDWSEGYTAPDVPFYENPFDITEPDDVRRAIEAGRVVYHKDATCWQCHPAYMPRDELETMIGGPARPDLTASLSKPDMWEQVVKPPDFPHDRLKSVRELRDLYRVITAGVGGTAMPTWKSALSGEQLWALTFYVDSLRPRSLALQMIAGGEE